MKEQVLDLLETKYDAMSFEDIMHELENTSGNSFTTEDVMELQSALNELVKSLDLYVTKKNKYILLSKMPNFKVGIIDVLAEATRGMTIADIQAHNITLAGLTSQKMARVLNELVDMGVVKKAQSRRTKRMMYMAVSAMEELGFISPTEEG